MSAHVEQLLVEYAAGTLAAGEVALVEAHLPGCPGCRRELAALDEAYACLALGLPPAAPPASLKSRILAGADRGGRFERLGARVAALLDLARDQARELLALIDDPDRWVPGPASARLIHLPGGPAVAGANCGFVRMAPGALFPLHRHLGEERVLVLQGGFRDDDGRIYRRGDEDTKPAGSEHRFEALPDTDLIYLVVLHGGLVIPSDPGFTL